MKTIVRLTSLVLILMSGVVSAQIDVERDVPCCEVHEERVVWAGCDSLMSFNRLAAHVAPVLWFSPGEPLLRRIRDREFSNIPMAFPFDDSSATPVVYYRIRSIITRDMGNAFSQVSDDRGDNMIDLSRVGHEHDVESVEMKVAIYRQTNCVECRFGLVVVMVNAKAHGILWYDNTLETDQDTEFPMHILVEEGKHASCTDKNGDGYFTPA